MDLFLVSRAACEFEGGGGKRFAVNIVKIKTIPWKTLLVWSLTGGVTAPLSFHLYNYTWHFCKYSRARPDRVIQAKQVCDKLNYAN